MALSVEGQKCPVCDGYLFDEDDVVYCPVCGAPHHRDCFKSVGHCGLEHLHGTENEYSKTKSENSDINNKTEKAAGNTEPVSPLGSQVVIKTVCPACKTEYDSNLKNCPNCGTPAPQMFTPFGSPISLDPLGGVPADANLEDGTSAKEVVVYTAVNTPRYVKKFFFLNKKNKLSWNWAAFLFPNSWFFYRKIYFPGVMFFILMAVSSVLALAINMVVGGMTFSGGEEMANYIVSNIETINKLPLILSFAGAALNLVLRIVAGLTGDWSYRKNALERINLAKSNSDSDDSETVRIHKMGGVNLFLALLGLMGIQWIQYFILALL